MPTPSDAATGEIIEFDGINLGLAVQGVRGLVAPAVLNAHAMTTRLLDAEVRSLTTRAREGRATPFELSAGTFTLNNYGSLGVGRIIDRPWVRDGSVAVRKMAQISFAFDHRVCDGGVAAGFMRFVADAIEDPASLLADL